MYNTGNTYTTVYADNTYGEDSTDIACIKVYVGNTYLTDKTGNAALLSAR
jgi:hypothetical protein